MTIEKLSKNYRLCEQLRRNEEILDSLRVKAEPGAANMDGMPHGSDVGDKVGSLAISIADMDAKNNELRDEIREERMRLERYISGIDDERLRLVFRLRFVNCCTWKEVADCLGAYYTAEGCYKLVYGYLRRTEDNQG